MTCKMKKRIYEETCMQYLPLQKIAHKIKLKSIKTLQSLWQLSCDVVYETNVYSGINKVRILK